MLLKQLSDDDKQTFLQLAELLSLSDKPIDHDADAGPVFVRNERDAEAMDDLVLLLSGRGTSISGFAPERTRTGIEAAFLGRLTALPQTSADDPVARVKIAIEMLRDVLKDKIAPTPSVPKLMLFELFMLALTTGNITSVQWQLLTELKHHYQIEEHLFGELLERAQCTHQETQRTVAIILE